MDAVKRRPRGPHKPARNALIARMARDGFRQVEIAETLQISRQRVHQILRQQAESARA